MLAAPEAATLAGRPAVHVRCRLLGTAPDDEAPVPDADPVPASLVEHWTVLVEERRDGLWKGYSSQYIRYYLDGAASPGTLVRAVAREEHEDGVKGRIA